MQRLLVVLALLIVHVCARNACALIIPSNEGKWPATWPK